MPQAIDELPATATEAQRNAKINEMIRAINARRLRPGPGMALDSSDDGIMVKLGDVTGTLDCNEGEPGGTMTLRGK